ncbi:MAG: endonuclease III [Acidobacteria bacterium]|nr:endonuclease III [Acidobacteriota bacterium]
MKSPAVAKRILDALERHHPDADTELHHSNAFELLVATILSAQSSDQRVNEVTPALFARYPDARALAAAPTDELEAQIRSTGFFRQKSRALIGMSAALVDRHAGQVPASMEALTALPGVGRKTANVVLGHALGVPGLPVDRHVLRVANRLGLTHSADPVKVEADLGALYPPKRWTRVSDNLILHGRRICRPTRPACEICNARKDCDFFISGGAVVKGVGGRARKSGRPGQRRPTRQGAGPPTAAGRDGRKRR